MNRNQLQIFTQTLKEKSAKLTRLVSLLDQAPGAVFSQLHLLNGVEDVAPAPLRPKTRSGSVHLRPPQNTLFPCILNHIYALYFETEEVHLFSYLAREGGWREREGNEPTNKERNSVRSL